MRLVEGDERAGRPRRLGSTMPVLVSAGSVRRSATSPPESAASTAARSLKGTSSVSSLAEGIGPISPREGTTRPFSSRAKVSSTWP